MRLCHTYIWAFPHNWDTPWIRMFVSHTQAKLALDGGKSLQSNQIQWFPPYNKPLKTSVLINLFWLINNFQCENIVCRSLTFSLKMSWMKSPRTWSLWWRKSCLVFHQLLITCMTTSYPGREKTCMWFCVSLRYDKTYFHICYPKLVWHGLVVVAIYLHLSYKNCKSLYFTFLTGWWEVPLPLSEVPWVDFWLHHGLVHPLAQWGAGGCVRLLTLQFPHGLLCWC